MRYEDVSDSQDENQRVLRAAVSEVDRNITKVFAEADLGARVVAILAAMDRAIHEELTIAHRYDDDKVNHAIASMYECLLEMHNNAPVIKRSTEEGRQALAARIARNFHDKTGD